MEELNHQEMFVVKASVFPSISSTSLCSSVLCVRALCKCYRESACVKGTTAARGAQVVRFLPTKRERVRSVKLLQE